MSGNVWEWTRSLWGKYPYEVASSREALAAADDVTRVGRGGAFDYVEWFVRSAFRGRSTPDDRYDFVGCRLVVSPFRS